MRILVVNQYALPSGVPGITRHGDLGAELVRRGHRVTVLASRFHYLTRRGHDERPSVEDRAGVEFRWLDTGGYARNDRRRTRSMVAFTLAAIRAGWRLPRPDVVLASSPHLLAGLAGLVLARRFRVPFVFEVRDLWPSVLIDLGAVRRGSIVHRGLQWVERLCYRAAARIVIVPPHADRRVAEVGIDSTKCVHVPNATTLDAGIVAAVPPSLRTMLERVGERRLVLYAGAQGVSNDLATLLGALEALRARDPAVFERLAVMLIGNGGEHEELVRRAEPLGTDNVLFHPPVDKSVVRALLPRADALLVSFADAPVYEYGLSPNKLFDYLAAGRPVLLASRLLDTPVDEAGAGARYEPGSVESLAAAIEAMMGLSEQERRAMGDRGRRLVAERYTISVTATELESALLSALDGPGR